MSPSLATSNSVSSPSFRFTSALSTQVSRLFAAWYWAFFPCNILFRVLTSSCRRFSCSRIPTDLLMYDFSKSMVSSMVSSTSSSAIPLAILDVFLVELFRLFPVPDFRWQPMTSYCCHYCSRDVSVSDGEL